MLGIGSRIKHNSLGEGVVVNVKAASYLITFMNEGMKEIPADHKLEVIEKIDPDPDLVSLFDVERTLTSILKKYLDATENVSLGTKWINGKIILVPGDSKLSSKEIPMDVFFHKIVMVRDRLRVMEQRINASNLSEEEKINLQQYITKIYGSLTSFNILFKRIEDQFTGEKSGI